MLLKLIDIMQSKKSLDILMEKKGIPAQAAFSLAKLHKAMKKECETFEAIRDKKIMEIGTPLENGSYQIPQDMLKKFNDDLQPLLDLEITLNFDPLPVSTFEAADIEPIIFSDLHWLLSA